MILESRKHVGQIVVPIFYKVDPSDVRHLRGSFAKAFAQHEQKFENDMEKVEKWKKALRKVVNISGYDLKGRDESRLIKEIIDDISHKILCMQSVPSGLVGMGPIMEKINELLELGSSDVRMVGIWGMAGIGKTTIAEAAYERISSQFRACCFLHNIKEKFHKSDGGIVLLQEELLSKISKASNISLDTKIGGRQQIQIRLSYWKVLIVVDDVDDSKQLKGLVGSCDWFGPGSRIIITTRDRHLLVQHEVKLIYEARKLGYADANKLFHQHAFNKEHPASELQDLSTKIVEYCQGLPLALEVLGSFMYGRSKLEWEAEINKLKRISDLRIQDVLKSSFDGLDDSQKELFLDIVCFLNGLKDMLAKRILDASPIDMSVLIDRSLISVVKECGMEVIRMHDLLQEMGRGIIRQESKGQFENQSRFIDYEDVHNLLARSMVTKRIKGISLFLDESKGEMKEIHEHRNAFATMGNLKFLNLRVICPKLAYSSREESKVLLCEDSGFLPSSLRYFHWHGCPFSRLSSKCNLENLVVLEMPYSPMKRLWEGVKCLPNLGMLDLSYCQNLGRIPNLCGAPNLEELILRGCSNLTRVHWSIGHLNNLKALNLEGCKKLKGLGWLGRDKGSHGTHFILCHLKVNKFSNSSGETKCLTRLCLNGTYIKELPSVIENLESLKLIYLRDCPRLESLTGNICKLKSLRELDLSRCLRLSIFPEVFETMPKLLYLCLRQTSIKTLPNSICKLQSLGWLELGGCSKFSILPKTLDGMKALAYIELEGTAIKKLPSIEGIYSNLPVLEECNRRLQRLRGSLRDSLQRHRQILRNHCSRFDSVTSTLRRLSNSESHLERILAELEVILNRLPSPLQPTPLNLRRDFTSEYGMCKIRMLSNLFPYQVIELKFKCRNLCEVLKINGMFQVEVIYRKSCIFGERIKALYGEFEENVKRMYQIISDLMGPSAFESCKPEIRIEKNMGKTLPCDLCEAALEEFIDCIVSPRSDFLHSGTREILYLSN